MKRVIAYKTLAAPLQAQLRERFELVCFDRVGAGEMPGFRAALHDAHGLVGSGLAFTAALLEAAPVLEAIATITVGYDNFDLGALTRRGVLLANTPDVLTETTADTIFALVLATARRVVELDGFVRTGQWREPVGPAQFGVDVHARTLGILGMGRIGQAVARRARLGFGMDVLYYNRSAVPAAEAALGARRVSLEELLARADFCCLVLPLSAETRQLVGAREFALMKPGAIFINGARGAIVDEAALVDALRSGRLHAAGLDVFAEEPLPAGSPLCTMPNVVLLPHVGSATHATREAMDALAVANLIAALEGRPQNVVNPAALAERAGKGRP